VARPPALAHRGGDESTAAAAAHATTAPRRCCRSAAGLAQVGFLRVAVAGVATEGKMGAAATEVRCKHILEYHAYIHYCDPCLYCCLLLLLLLRDTRTHFSRSFYLWRLRHRRLAEVIHKTINSFSFIPVSLESFTTIAMIISHHRLGTCWDQSAAAV
jgi:hypothetical protein